jgi:hypothetical protein
MKIKRIFFLLFSSFLLFSCNTNSDKSISEGIIEYDAVCIDPANPMANMAPSKMTVKFKNNKSLVQMSAGMGLFSTTFISDPQTNTLSQLVKLMNKKFATVMDKKDIEKEISEFDFVISPEKETKMIAGIKCKKATVKSKSGEYADFNIYYTDEFKIENPNFSNPFHSINGVLMEYQLKKFGLELRFNATKVTYEPVDDSQFEVPDEYKKISLAEMNEIFEGLQ